MASCRCSGLEGLHAEPQQGSCNCVLCPLLARDTMRPVLPLGAWQFKRVPYVSVRLARRSGPATALDLPCTLVTVLVMYMWPALCVRELEGGFPMDMLVDGFLGNRHIWSTQRMLALCRGKCTSGLTKSCCHSRPSSSTVTAVQCGLGVAAKCGCGGHATSRRSTCSLH